MSFASKGKRHKTDKIFIKHKLKNGKYRYGVLLYAFWKCFAVWADFGQNSGRLPVSGFSDTIKNPAENELSRNFYLPKFWRTDQNYRDSPFFCKIACKLKLCSVCWQASESPIPTRNG